jgi:hypothetical protein
VSARNELVCIEDASEGEMERRHKEDKVRSTRGDTR